MPQQTNGPDMKNDITKIKDKVIYWNVESQFPLEIVLK